MKALFSLVCFLVAVLPVCAINPAMSVTSKDGTINFTKQIYGFRQPVTVTDTTDQPGGCFILTDAETTRVIKIERIPFGSTAWATKPKGPVDEPYLKSVMAAVRVRDYPTAAGFDLRRTRHESVYEAYGAPTLVVLDDLKKTTATRTTPGPRNVRGYLLFAATNSVVVVQYECTGMTIDGSRREFPSTEFLQWVARNLVVKDL